MRHARGLARGRKSERTATVYLGTWRERGAPVAENAGISEVKRRCVGFPAARDEQIAHYTKKQNAVIPEDDGV
jgi:hypothetical protein